MHQGHVYIPYPHPSFLHPCLHFLLVLLCENIHHSTIGLLEIEFTWVFRELCFFFVLFELSLRDGNDAW